MNEKLLQLTSDDFWMDMFPISHYNLVHRRLQQHALVVAIREEYQAGTITDEQIRDFVDNHLMKDFQRGVQFPHELAICALAVVLQEEQTPFADEYINDLAGLQIAEIHFGSGVARICQEVRNG